MSNDVVTAVRAHSVVIVKGNTGCGKTTQVYTIHTLIIQHTLSCYAYAGASVYTG